MGEKIKDLSKIIIKDKELLIELNKGTHKLGKYDVHIQNSDFRLNVNEKDFLKIALTTLYAKENLEYIKMEKKYEQSSRH